MVNSSKELNGTIESDAIDEVSHKAMSLLSGSTVFLKTGFLS
jgi:hypothetical protein